MNAAFYRKLLAESFLPVLLLIGGLFVLLLFTQFRTISNAEQVLTIVIQGDSDGDNEDEAAQQELAGITFSSRRDNDPDSQRAQQAIKRQQWAEAEAIFLAMLAKNRSSQTLNDLGVVYFKQAKLDSAWEKFNDALNQEPVYSGAYFNRGVTNARLGHYRQAIEDYERLIKINPNHFEAHFNLGVAYIKQKKYQQAIDTLAHTATLAGGARKARALYNQGFAYTKLEGEHRDQARKLFQQAIRVKPDYIEARFGLASLLNDDKQGRQDALEIYQTVLDLHPGYAPALFRMAGIHKDQKDLKAAELAYREALRSQPNYLAARYNLGLILEQSERWNDARDQFAFIVGEQSNNERALFHLGRVENEQKNYPRAIEYYQDAIKASKDGYPEAKLNLAAVYKSQKDYARAESIYRELIKDKPDYALAWHNLGLLQMRNKQYKQAERSLLTTLQYNPRHAVSWYNLGILYTRLDDNQRAIDAYQKALEIRPDYQKAMLNLAVRYSQTESHEQAIKTYLRLIKSDDSYANAWLNLCITYSRVDKSRQGIEACERAIELEPENPKGHAVLGELYLVRKDTDSAIQHLEQAISLNTQNAEYRHSLALAYRAAGNLKAARASLDKALALEPDNSVFLQTQSNF